MELSHYCWLGLQTDCNWGSLHKSHEGGLSTVIGRSSIVAKAHELLFHNLACVHAESILSKSGYALGQELGQELCIFVRVCAPQL